MHDSKTRAASRVEKNEIMIVMTEAINGSLTAETCSQNEASACCPVARRPLLHHEMPISTEPVSSLTFQWLDGTRGPKETVWCQAGPLWQVQNVRANPQLCPAVSAPLPTQHVPSRASSKDTG